MNRQEEILQAKCTQWFNNEYLKFNKMVFAVHNNAENRIKGAMLKAIGVKDGVSDLIINAPNGKTIYCELKTPEGRQSDGQKEFQRQCESLQHEYVIVRTFEEFQLLIKKYFD